MIITKKCMSRRTVLRGMGATIALPLLDGMVPAFAAAGNPAAVPARRFGAIYVPMGMAMEHWTPLSAGPGFELTPIMAPLAPFRDHLLVVSGLNSEEAAPRDDDGGGGGPHSRSQTTWLTGARAKKTEGADFRAGTSMDQIAAQELGHETELASLELALESVGLVGACDYGYTCAYSSTIAWRTPTTPLPMEIEPRVVFERLFGDSDSTDRRSRLSRSRKEKSILDSVTEAMTRFQQGLGPSDRTKLSEYFESVRDIERRIQKAEEQSDHELPVVPQPVGIPDSFEEQATLMFDLWALAYQADLTRIATFMMARELSTRTYPEIGISEPHHPLSHHQGNPEKLARQAKLNTYHVKMLAHFLEKLQSTPDGEGSLLDHTVILYGSGMSNSNSHSPHDLPTLVVGGGVGKVKGGRHLRYPLDTPLANLQLALLDKIGVPVERFGDSHGMLNLLSL